MPTKEVDANSTFWTPSYLKTHTAALLKPPSWFATHLSDMAISIDSMPPEVQFIIFSYLVKPFAGYVLDGTPRSFTILGELEKLTPSKASDLLKTHPFQNLAAMNKQLRSAIEGYCHQLLKEHKVVLGNKKLPELDGQDWNKLANENAHYEENVKKGKIKKVDWQTYRNLWIRATHETCIWCGKKSTRRAIFDMLVYCCASCDERVYGKKVSKSKAMQTYKLKPLLWLRPGLVFENRGVRRLNVATREGSTFLLEKEVKALAKYYEENDPDGSISKRAIQKYGAEAERVVGESVFAPILFWRVTQQSL